MRPKRSHDIAVSSGSSPRCASSSTCSSSSSYFVTNISPNVRGSTKRINPPWVKWITTCVCLGAFSRAGLRAAAADPTSRGARSSASGPSRRITRYFPRRCTETILRPSSSAMNSFLFLCRRTERVPVTSTVLIFLPTTSFSRSRRKTSTSGSSGMVAPLSRQPRPAGASMRPTRRTARLASSIDLRPRRTGGRSRRPTRRSASRDPGPRRARRTGDGRADRAAVTSCRRVL